jgi:metallo-beta-lactamase class B
MRRPLPALLLALGLTALAPGLAHAQKDPTSRSWNQPVEPFRIAGNLYYVGASDITSFLIATPGGLILLDGGFAETAPLIRDSVKKLGFRLEDVKYILSTHAHYDHAGGLAALKRWTGARLVAGEADAPLLAAGGHGDFRFGDRLTFPPVTVDRTVKDGDTVTLGGTTLTAHATPGHTRGCTTWTMQVADGGKTYDAVFVGSATINPGVVLTANPQYPAIAADYARTFETLKKLPCDLFLAAHGAFFDLQGKMAKLRQRKDGGANPFLDPQGYREHVRQKEELYRRQLAQEREKAKAKAALPVEAKPDPQHPGRAERP